MTHSTRLTAAQFDAIAALIGSHKASAGGRPKAAAAARLVLVDGEEARDVRLALGISGQALSNALRRYRSAHELILAAYSPVRA